jgi:hypothetical protein
MFTILALACSILYVVLRMDQTTRLLDYAVLYTGAELFFTVLYCTLSIAQL